MSSLSPMPSALTGEGRQGLSPAGQAQTDPTVFEDFQEDIRLRLQHLTRTGTYLRFFLPQSSPLRFVFVDVLTESFGRELQGLIALGVSGNSTIQQPTGEELKKRLEVAFRWAKDIQFEDGMENEFSRELLSLMERHENSAVDAVGELILSENVSPAVASEALRWLGGMDDATTYQKRLWLLEKCLFSSSPVVRDGAVVGVASMDDPSAIPYLRKARDKEPLNDLRKDMGQVLEQLQETLECRSY